MGPCAVFVAAWGAGMDGRFWKLARIHGLRGFKGAGLGACALRAAAASADGTGAVVKHGADGVGWQRPKGDNLGGGWWCWRAHPQRWLRGVVVAWTGDAVSTLRGGSVVVTASLAGSVAGPNGRFLGGAAIDVRRVVNLVSAL